MKYALNGVQTLKNQPYSKELSKCYNLMGVVYNSKGDSLHALEWYLDAMDLIIKNDDITTLSSIYNNIGCLYDGLKNYEVATEYFNKALELVEDKKSEVYSLEIINLSLMYCELEEWDKVEEYYRIIENIKEKHILYTNEIHLAIIRFLIAYRKDDIDEVKRQIEKICTRILNDDLSTNNFDEIVNSMSKIIDIRLTDELSKLISILNETSHVRNLVGPHMALVDADIQLNELIGNEKEVIRLSKLYYQLSKIKHNEQSRMVMDGIHLKLQMREMQLEHQKMEEQTEMYQRRAQRDELTGLYNRSLFKDKIEPMFKKAIEKQLTVGVIIADINDFKLYNDYYGHIKGDRCIREISNVMLRIMDENIYFLRYGGDEFFGFFYDMDELTIKGSIHMIHSEIRSLNLEHKKSTYPSKLADVTQGGYISVPRSTDTLYDFIANADEQLYQGKRDKEYIMIKSKL